jgi:hypothetical protein
LRIPLALLSIVAIAIPLLGVGVSPRGGPSVDSLLSAGSLAGGILAAVALLAGAIVGDVLWRADARHGHSYAMSLPIRRNVFLRYRALGGALLLLMPAAAMLVGIAAIAIGADFPPGVHTYAWETAARAWVVMLLALSLTLGLRLGVAARGRRVLLITGVILTVGVLLESEVSPDRPLRKAMNTAFFGKYSPFAVVFSRWPVVDL